MAESLRLGLGRDARPELLATPEWRGVRAALPDAAGTLHRLQDGFHFMVGQPRHHRGQHGAHRNACGRQTANGFQPAGRCGAARLHPARQIGV